MRGQTVFIHERSRGDLEEALHMAGRVFRPCSIVAVRQQDHHPVLEQPLGLAWERTNLPFDMAKQ